MNKRNNMSGKEQAEKIKASVLETAVELTPDVAGSCQAGLSALGAYSAKIVVPDTRNIGGSVNIDSATKELYPMDSRWDYALEYDCEVFFIEVHPGSTSEVDTVLKKLDWLKSWLQNKAPEINRVKTKNKQAYHWIYTGSFSILKTSRHYKLLSQKGLIPKRQWD